MWRRQSKFFVIRRCSGELFVTVKIVAHTLSSAIPRITIKVRLPDSKSGSSKGKGSRVVEIGVNPKLDDVEVSQPPSIVRAVGFFYCVCSCLRCIAKIRHCCSIH